MSARSVGVAVTMEDVEEDDESCEDEFDGEYGDKGTAEFRGSAPLGLSGRVGKFGWDELVEGGAEVEPLVRADVGNGALQ